MAVSYTSGSIKVPGLGNGTDFSTMIDQLERIEMSHALQLNSWKKDWQTRLDAFDTVSKALADYSKTLKSINKEETFLAKTLTLSNEKVCTVKALGTADNATHSLDVKQLASNSYANLVFDVANKTDSINPTSSMMNFSFTLDGTAYNFDVPPNTTLEGLKNMVNQKYAKISGQSLGMKASIIEAGGKQMLQLYSTETGSNTQISIVSAGFDPSVTSGSWTYQNGQNAMVRVNGFPADPDYREITKNTVADISGLTINLQSVGQTTITVGLDKAHIKESINKFVDATNAVRTLLYDYTRVDNNKTTVASDYADSQFDTQKGGVLTGNYGIQLVMSKMKTSILSKPMGFSYLERDANNTPISGDTFAALSHLGIKTDDVQGSATYGLLIFEDNIQYVLEGKTTLITLDDAIDMDPEGIAELFAAKNKPEVDSNNFGFASMVQGQCKGGEFDVKYEVAADGKVIDGTVFINGKAAKYYPDTNQIMLIRGEGADNDADGILLDIYNNTPTNGVPHTGKVRIKQGLLNELTNMVDVDFLDPDSGEKDKVKGTISVLQSQYKKIISNINAKIAREDERLIVWRRRMEDRFSRLETTLKTYEGLQAMVESQVNSLSSASKK